MIEENASLEEVRSFFQNDRYAVERTGCRIVEAGRGHAVCEFDVTPTHLNAAGSVMGGSIFTLADYAAGIAANIGQIPSVSVASEIRFLKAPRGTKLIATCDADRMGHTLGFFTTKVTDDLGTDVAIVSCTMSRVGEK